MTIQTSTATSTLEQINSTAERDVVSSSIWVA